MVIRLAQRRGNPGMSRVLPQQLYTAEQVRQLDHLAIHQFGIDGFELMTRAARACFDAICQRWPNLTTMQVFCGGGNNGGDGYLIARMAHEHNIKVSVQALKDPVHLKGDAQKAWLACDESGVFIKDYDPATQLTADVIVDAMLGTGLSSEVQGQYLEVVNRINSSGKPVCAADIPSGLCANTGQPLGAAVKADLTVTFIGLKQGLFTGLAADYCGELKFARLDVPDEVFREVSPSCEIITQQSLGYIIPRRLRTAHKGHHGHVLLVGGNYGMPGAIIMAAEAAIYSGAGLVSVATREEHLSALSIRRPEIMAHAVHDGTALKKLVKGKGVIVIGPGLGRDDWALELLKKVLAADCALVMDADALNLISEHPQLHKARKFPMILTPHPGEAARLLNTSTIEIQQDRFTAVLSCCQAFNAITLLKGSGTLISNGHEITLCDAGNPGMAVGGMGDILSGLTGALLAQDVEPFEAAQLAAWVHATAADRLVSNQGEIGLLATELLPEIRRQINRIHK